MNNEFATTNKQTKINNITKMLGKKSLKFNLNEYDYSVCDSPAENKISREQKKIL